MRYLTNTGEGSSKFWEGRVDGASLVVRYGKIGTDGQRKTKTLGSEAEAEAELAKLVREKLGKGYVESKSGDGSGTTGAESAAPASFPFLFFGHRPGDWASGANMGHAYEVRFRSPPDRKTRLAIAKAFETALSEGPVQTSSASEPWLWAGHWAMFFVGERGARDADACFQHMESAFRAIHEVAPLGEVVFGGAREHGDGPWDRWSFAQQPGPSWDPHFPNYLRHPDPDYPPIQGEAPAEDPEDGVADAAFEAAREKARGKTEKSVGKKGARAKVSLVAIPADAFPTDPPVPAEIAARFPEVLPPTVFTTPSGWIVALGTKPKTLNQEGQLLFFETPSSAPKTVKLPKDFYVSEALSPAGDRVFVVGRASGDGLEVSIPQGKARKVHHDPTYAIAASYLDGDRLVVLADQLTLLAREGDVMCEVGRSSVSGFVNLATAQGKIVAVNDDGKLHVFSATNEGLVEVAKIACRVRVLVVKDDRVYLTNNRFRERRNQFFELHGLSG